MFRPISLSPIGWFCVTFAGLAFAPFLLNPCDAQENPDKDKAVKDKTEPKSKSAEPPNPGKGKKKANPPTIIKVSSGSPKPGEVEPDKRPVVEGMAKLNSLLTIVVDDPEGWVAETKPANIVLYLERYPIPKMPPRIIHRNHKSDSKRVELAFDLVRNNDTKEAWDKILGEMHYLKSEAPFFTTDHFVTVGIGTLEGEIAEEKEPRIDFELFGLLWIPGAVVVAATGCLLWWLACNTTLLRDFGPDPPGKERPYSLGRCQMAFWFFLVFASAVFIVFITRDSAVMIFPASILALMGISSLTTLSAVMVDDTQQAVKEEKARVGEAWKTQERLKDEIKKLEALGAAATPAQQAELVQKKAELRTSEESIASVQERYISRGIFKDLLFNVEAGAALHRFQMVAWTVVLGMVFIYAVGATLKMPSFDSSLLLLMGITNFTYVGFKVPENRAGQRP